MIEGLSLICTLLAGILCILILISAQLNDIDKKL